MSAQPIPEVYDSLIPSLVVADAAKAIQFYKDVFGAQEIMRMNYPDSPKIAHAELKIRNHVLMLGDECPEMGVAAPKPGGPPPPRSTMIYVADVDATFQKALSKVATVAMPIMDMFWGDRYGKFMDPFGHLWGVATHTKKKSKREWRIGGKRTRKSRCRAIRFPGPGYRVAIDLPFFEELFGSCRV
jgi:PhnB protein